MTQFENERIVHERKGEKVSTHSIAESYNRYMKVKYESTCSNVHECVCVCVCMLYSFSQFPLGALLHTILCMCE